MTSIVIAQSVLLRHLLVLVGDGTEAELVPAPVHGRDLQVYLDQLPDNTPTSAR